MPQTVRLERRGATLVITLARPERRNALDVATIRCLTEAVEAAGVDADLRAVVLEAEGDTFCAGADLREVAAAQRAGAGAVWPGPAGWTRLFEVLDMCPKPTIAKVVGRARGGGVGLIASCDLAVCTPDADFAFPETSLGLVPAVVASYVIRAIGFRSAQRYFLTGEPIRAEEALRLNLVHAVTAKADLDACCDGWIEALGTSASAALAATKNLARRFAHFDRARARTAADVFSSALASSEAAEGLKARMP